VTQAAKGLKMDTPTEPVRVTIVPFGTVNVSAVIPAVAAPLEEKAGVALLDLATAQTRLVSVPPPTLSLKA